MLRTSRLSMVALGATLFANNYHAVSGSTVVGARVFGCADGIVPFPIDMELAAGGCQSGEFAFRDADLDTFEESFRFSCPNANDNQVVKIEFFTDQNCETFAEDPLLPAGVINGDPIGSGSTCEVECGSPALTGLTEVVIKQGAISPGFSDCETIPPEYVGNLETFTTYEGACLPVFHLPGETSPTSMKVRCVDGAVGIDYYNLDCTELSFSSLPENKCVYMDTEVDPNPEASTVLYSYRITCNFPEVEVEEDPYNGGTAIPQDNFLSHKLVRQIEYSDTSCSSENRDISVERSVLSTYCHSNLYETRETSYSKLSCEVNPGADKTTVRLKHFLTEAACKNDVGGVLEEYISDEDGFVECSSDGSRLNRFRCTDIRIRDPIVRFEGYSFSQQTNDAAVILSALSCNKTDEYGNEFQANITSLQTAGIGITEDHLIYSVSDACVAVCPNDNTRFSYTVTCLADRTPKVEVYRGCNCEGTPSLSPALGDLFSSTDSCGLYNFGNSNVGIVAGRFACLQASPDLELTLEDQVPEEYGEAGVQLTLIVAGIIVFFFVILCMRSRSRREEVRKKGGVDAIVQGRFTNMGNLQQRTLELGGGRALTIVRDKKNQSAIKLAGTVEINHKDIKLGVSISSNSTSKVFTGTYQGSQVAVKEVLGEGMSSARRKSKGSKSSFAREISILSQLDHPAIVRLFGASLAPDAQNPGRTRKLIVMELAKCSLKDAIRRDAPYDVCVVLAWVEQTFSGLVYLHESGMLHGNLKPSNILIDSAGNAKLCDFGMSKEGSDGSDVELGQDTPDNPAFTAPEAFGKGHKRTRQGDVYALTMVLWEVLHNGSLFPNLSPSQIASRVSQGERPPIHPGVPPHINLLLKRGWSAMPSQRPPARVMLEELSNALGGLSATKRSSGKVSDYLKPGDIVSVWQPDLHLFYATPAVVASSVSKGSYFEVKFEGKDTEEKFKMENLVAHKALLRVK